MQMLRNVNGGGVTPSSAENSRELSCKKETSLEISKKLDCFGSEEPHNDDTNSVILSESERSHGRENITNNAILRGLNCYSPQNDCKNYIAHWENSRKIAFTEPSRGMSGAKVEQTSAETLSFRCVCERCRLTRGEVSKTSRKGATHVAHWKNSSKIAFTLAEVLITLGIIGVVAAITMPTLIQSYQKQVYANGAKKGLNVVMNTMSKIQADEGVSDFLSTSLFSDGICSIGSNDGCEDGYGDSTVIEKTIPKYIKTIKTCKNEECNILYTGGWYDSNEKKLKLYDGKSLFRNINNSWSTTFGFYAADGALYYVYPSEAGLSFSYDINGEKGPNTEGRDLFSVHFCRNGKINYAINSNISCNDDGIDNGYWYPLRILMNNGWKMDY